MPTSARKGHWHCSLVFGVPMVSLFRNKVDLFAEMSPLSPRGQLGKYYFSIQIWPSCGLLIFLSIVAISMVRLATICCIAQYIQSSYGYKRLSGIPLCFTTRPASTTHSCLKCVLLRQLCLWFVSYPWRVASPSLQPCQSLVSALYNNIFWPLSNSPSRCYYPLSRTCSEYNREFNG